MSDITQADLDSAVKKALAEQLTGLKDKLDSAYSKRDAAEEALNTFKAAEEVKAAEEAKAAEVEAKRLEEDGKHREAFELKLQERDKRIGVLEGENITLTRDNSVRSHLSNYTFSNENAANMAFRTITSGLTKDEKGSWGDITSTVSDFMAASENNFLLKEKVNSGSGEKQNKNTGEVAKKPSQIPQSELLAKIAAGEM